LPQVQVHTQAILLLQVAAEVQLPVTQQVLLMVVMAALVVVLAQETLHNLAVVGCLDKAMMVAILVIQVVAHTLPLVEVVREL
jgi:hypothetical protein